MHFIDIKMTSVLKSTVHLSQVVQQITNSKVIKMAKSVKSPRNQQLEVFGFFALATLSIPAIIMCGYGIYQLIKALA